MGVKLAWAWAPGAALLSIACQLPPAFVCSEHAECGADGQCELAGACSFPDADCPDGRRYGRHADAAFANTCVAVEPDGSSAAEASGAPPVPDPDATTSGAAGSTSIFPLTDSGIETGTTDPIEASSTTSLPVEPDAEVCDGVDNDRDGLVDEASSENLECDGCLLSQLDGSAYWICEGPAIWQDARDACLARGGDLASIHDALEDAFLAAYVDTWPTRYLWLGGNDLATEGVWAWSDGTPWDYAAWALDQPDDAMTGEDCLHHRSEKEQWQWNDLPCDDLRAFICEAPHPG